MSKFSLLTKILPVCCIFFLSCVRNGKEEPSGEAGRINIHRFEKDLFALDTMHFASSMQKLNKEFPAFSNTYFSNVFGIDPGDTSGYRLLRKRIDNHYIREVASGIDSVYPNLNTISASLADAFERYRNDFPGAAEPSVFTYPASLSGFQPAVWNTDSILAIGLDCFLGKNYHFYQTTTYPQYIIRRFTPEHLVPTALKGFLQYHYPPGTENKTFLSNVIYEGKILYLLDRMLPATPDSLKIGYTTSEIGWAKTYERDIWAYFIERKLLYSTDALDYSKYLDEAPFTSDLGSQSAPRIGAFTGWQIVRKYMEKNKNVTLPELMAEKDAQKILSLSKYKPK